MKLVEREKGGQRRKNGRKSHKKKERGRAGMEECYINL